MRRLGTIWLWLRSLFRRRAAEADLDDELRFHLERTIEENIASGLVPEEARRQALLDLGGPEQVKESCREACGTYFLEAPLRDFRYALRVLRKSPGFASIAILTLALGIGANTALFGLLDALVLRDLPVWQPSRLVEVETFDPRERETGPLSLAMYEGIARGQRVFSNFSGTLSDAYLNVQANGWLGPGDVSLVSGEFYSMMGVRPALGRLIGPSDVNLMGGVAARIAVLGYSFWQRRYGGSPSAIGKIVKVAGVPFTIVGVAPKGFTGTSVEMQPEVTIPLSAAPVVGVVKSLNTRHFLWITAFGRLKPGVSLAQSRTDLQAIWPAVRQASLPSGESTAGREHFFSFRILVRSVAHGTESMLRSKYGKPLEILMVIAGLILLLACANLAGLMLARWAARDHEMAVKLALGAGGASIARQMLAEGILVAGAGACAGIALAWAAGQSLVALITEGYTMPVVITGRPDARALGFAIALAIFTGVLVGIAAAWHATRQDPMQALHSGPRTIGATGRLGKLLVALQLALAMVLLSCAGMLIRSLVDLETVKTGYQAKHVLIAQLAPRPGKHATVNGDVYWPTLLRRIAQLPGVVSASASDYTPGAGGAWKPAVSPARKGSKVSFLAPDVGLSPRFFRTLGMHIVVGRDFSWSDTKNSPRVAIVSQSLANRLFPNGDAIGRHIRIVPSLRNQPLEIVGVVSDARLFNARSADLLAVYTPLTQGRSFDPYATIEVRTAGSPLGLGQPVRRAAGPEGHEYVLSFQTLDEVRSHAALSQRLTAMLSGFFGGLGLLLAAIGLFGLISYDTKRRTREIGIRMALGADAASVRGMILRQAGLLTALGLGVGLIGALAATHLIAAMLFGVGPDNVSTLLSTSAVFLGVVLLAAYLPAHRAMRVDPNVALRHE